MDIQKVVGRKLNLTNRLIAEEAYKRGVTFEKLPKRRFKLKHGNQSFIVRRGKILNSPNSRLAAKVVARKEVLSRILISKGFHCPENAVFNPGEVDRAWEWAKSILPVVLKPARGKQGRAVYVNVNDYHEFAYFFRKIAEEYDDILVEKFIEGPEYR